MAVTFLEPGSAATQDLKFFIVTSGTVTSDAQAVHGSVRSIKCATAGGGASYAEKGNVAQDAGTRIHFSYRFNTLTTAGRNSFFRINSSVPIYLKLDLDGKIRINDLTPGSAVLATNTDYDIAVSFRLGIVNVWLNGALELSASGLDTNANAIRFGRNILAQSVDTGADFFAHIYIDDDTAANFPGNIRVTTKRPFADGTVNGFTTQIGSGNSGYGSGHADEVNERPLSITNGWSMAGLGSAVTEEYSIEGPSVGDVDLTGKNIREVAGWVYAKSLISETAQIKVGGVSSNISLTNTNTLFTKFTGVRTYPAGGTDIGIITDTSLTTVSLYECGLLVAYDDLVFNTPRENAKYTHFWGGR